MGGKKSFTFHHSSYHVHAYDSLMLSHISTAPASTEDESRLVVADDDSAPIMEGGTFQPILNLFPAVFTHDRNSGSALDSYTLHARIVMNQV